MKPPTRTVRTPPRSADFQSAVSPTSSRQDVRGSPRPAGCRTATPQAGKRALPATALPTRSGRETTWPNPTRSLALLLSVLPFANLSTTAAAPGRQAATDPGIQLLAESLTGAGGGVQTGAAISHVSQMTAIHYSPARNSESDVVLSGGFIPQGGAMPQPGDGVRILWIIRTGVAEVEIGWTSNPAASYAVESAAFLPTTDWDPVGTVIAEEQTSSLSIPLGPLPRFFRVQQLP